MVVILHFEDDYSGSGSGFDRPDVVGPIKYNAHDPQNYVDLSSFAIPCTILPSIVADPSTASTFASDCVPGTRHFGNEGRNSLHGPAFKEWNFALYKTTAITERVTMQLRADFFNVFNHAQYTPGSIDSVDPVTTTGVGSVNTINAGTLNLFNQPGQIFSSHPRVIQLALRLDF